MQKDRHRSQQQTCKFRHDVAVFVSILARDSHRKQDAHKSNLDKQGTRVKRERKTNKPLAYRPHLRQYIHIDPSDTLNPDQDIVTNGTYILGPVTISFFCFLGGHTHAMKETTSVKWKAFRSRSCNLPSQLGHRQTLKPAKVSVSSKTS